MSDAPAATSRTAALGDRGLFPDLDPPVFLNHAAISPPSLAVRDQTMAFLDDYAAGGVRGFVRWLPQKQRLKEKLAALVGAGAEDLAFVANTTTGVSNIALCMPWKKGDRILLYEGDFPANVTPWQQAARLFGLEVEFLPVETFQRSHDEGLAALKLALGRPARLVSTSLVRFQTGLRLPVAEMGAAAHAAGAELFVDGIQGIGAVPFDVTNVDYLACGGHKWLMGLEGVGFLYVDPRRVGSLVPRVAGWLSHEDALDFLFLGEGHLRHDRPIRSEANVFELGAANGIGCAALEASLDLIAQLGVRSIHEHLQRFHDALEPRLVELGLTSERHREPEGRSGSLCVRVPGRDLAEVARQVADRGVAVTTPDGRLRFAPHWPNSFEQVESIDAALRRVLV